MVSIIIPYHNRPQKVARAVASVLNQTFQDIEIILVDDASEKPFVLQDAKITHLRNGTNLGPGSSRNVGLNHAQGDYLVFMDSDDYWDTTFLEKTFSVMKKNPDTIMVYSDVFMVDESENIIGEMKENTNRPLQILPHILVRGRPWCTSSCLWNREMISGLQWTTERTWEDYVFDVRAALISNDIKAIDEHLVYYDASGPDKLSFTAASETIVEKTKSIEKIAKSISESSLFRDNKCKEAVSKLLLNNRIALIDYSVADFSLFQRNLSLLKKCSPKSLIILIQIFSALPKTQKLVYLRKLKNWYFTNLKGI